MPLFGSHLSIAGGLYKAVETAARLNINTVQIFTHSPSQWGVKPFVPNDATKPSDAAKSSKNGASQTIDRIWQGKMLADADIQRFREAIDRLGIQRPCAHDSYLINLATPDEPLWHKSVEGLVAELIRAESLGLEGVVMHPGSFVASSEEAGQRRIVQGLNEVLRRTPGLKVQCWLETTAGQGTNLGHRFEHLAYVLNEVCEPERFGVCVDSCHIFAAGYPLQSKSEYQATMDEFDRIIGIQQIRAWHLNDSKKPLGSRVDRHEHIGEGFLGLDPFRHIVNDPRFADIPMYLETEKGQRDGQDLDEMNLATLRKLLKSPATKKKKTP